MRIACGLVLFLAATTTLWGQMEPCLAGADSPDCGIKVVVAPPPEPPDENVIWAPSEVTIDVPLRMHPTKIQLNAGPAGPKPRRSSQLPRPHTTKKSATLRVFRCKSRAVRKATTCWCSILCPRVCRILLQQTRSCSNASRRRSSRLQRRPWPRGLPCCEDGRKRLNPQFRCRLRDCFSARSGSAAG